MAIQVAALLRTIASLAYIIGVLVAVFAVWVQLEETTAANVERVAKERGDCGVNMYQCEKQLKTFEQCTAVDETVAADVTLCAAVDVDDALAANCVAAGTGLGTPQCAYTQAPGKAVGQALCIPIGLVRNGYYDCVGLQEACTAADETVAADVALCAAVVLGGNSLTCTQADAENWGKCTYWGVDVVSDFADEKCASLFSSPARAHEY